MKKLAKSNDSKMICGVCGGIAEYLGCDPTVVRLAAVAISVLGGSGLLLYIVAAVLMPNAEDAAVRAD